MKERLEPWEMQVVWALAIARADTPETDIIREVMTSALDYVAWRRQILREGLTLRQQGGEHKLMATLRVGPEGYEIEVPDWVTHATFPKSSES